MALQEHADSPLSTAEVPQSILDRIDALTAANRREPDPSREQELVGLRHRAFSAMSASPRPGPWPRSIVASGDRPPELSGDELTPEVVAQGVVGHGSLVVRGLVPRAEADHMIEEIGRAQAAKRAYFDDDEEGIRPEYFSMFTPDEGYTVPRAFSKAAGDVLAVDSPRLLYETLELYERAGLRDVITTYLGQRPAMSARKSTLRKVPPDSNSGWHQDGAFMGSGIRALNVWIALSSCGEHAPSLDIVPRRFDGIVEAGTHGAYFDWCVGPGKVDELLAGEAPWRPVFEPGDAIIFDDLCLHRTGVSETMTEHRYAIENWFFAPAAYPPEQVPLLW